MHELRVYVHAGSEQPREGGSGGAFQRPTLWPICVQSAYWRIVDRIRLLLVDKLEYVLAAGQSCSISRQQHEPHDGRVQTDCPVGVLEDDATVWNDGEVPHLTKKETRLVVRMPRSSVSGASSVVRVIYLGNDLCQASSEL